MDRTCNARLKAPAWTLGDLAYELEARGVSPDGFERVVRLALGIVNYNTPAALTDVSPTHRIGACLAEHARHFSGERLGDCLGRTVLAWEKTEREPARLGRFFDLGGL